jgi:protein ImuA
MSLTSAIKPYKSPEILARLQSDILRMQGFRPFSNTSSQTRLGPILKAFPNQAFPIGAVHEFLSPLQEDLAASTGFIAGLLSILMKENASIIWISPKCNTFPPALSTFGLSPERFIFIEAKNEKDLLWTIEEALKCAAASAVIGEIGELDFTTSRRLQLAVEQSQVTGFLLRRKVSKSNATACVSRWKITSLPSISIEDLPGIGVPVWKVELLKIRNGKPDSWNVKYINGNFDFTDVPGESYAVMTPQDNYIDNKPRKAG